MPNFTHVSLNEILNLKLKNGKSVFAIDLPDKIACTVN